MSERYWERNEELRTVLLELRGADVLYFRNPGNIGDMLIAEATDQIFELFGFEPDRKKRIPDDVGEKTLVFGGGGALVPLYRSVTERIIDGLSRNPARVIVLPHTLRGQEDLLSRMRSQDVVFCRDARSRDHVRDCSSARAVLADDLAFAFDYAKFRRGLTLEQRLRLEIRVRKVVRSNQLSRRRLRARPVLHAMRRDAESVEEQRVLSDIDLSSPGVPRKDKSVAALGAFLSIIGMSNEIHTDRLHVSIACARLGTPALLYPNSYDKNAAVFLNSEALFDGVRWAEQ